MSSLADQALLDLLTDSGVQVSVDGEELCVRAPRGVLSVDDWDMIRESKAGLIALLGRRETPALSIPSYPWRVELSSWPDAWRQRWGELANRLQEEGAGWKDSEELAFDSVRTERLAIESDRPRRRKVMA